jgi:transposase
LALARHCLAYNDATDYRLHKLSSIDIQDIVQCSAATLCRLRKSWKKTRDVERLYKAGGRPRKIEDRLEEALVQLFLDHMDMTIDEALEWLNEEFKVSVNKTTIKQNPLPLSSHS